MRYKIILLLVVWLFSNCLQTNFINGVHTFTGPQSLPWKHNGCGSLFDCFALALPVAVLFRNLLGQINIGPLTLARTTPTTPARTTPRTTPTTPARTTTTPALACPANYSLYDESCGRFCYRYESSDCQDWSNARKACQSDAGDLLDPNECNYQFFSGRAFQNEGICAKNFWLGAQRPTDGANFITVRGDPILNSAYFWETGQPDNRNGQENCLEMRRDFSYLANDQKCSQIHGYICRK